MNLLIVSPDRDEPVEGQPILLNETIAATEDTSSERRLDEDIRESEFEELEYGYMNKDFNWTITELYED